MPSAVWKCPHCLAPNALYPNESHVHCAYCLSSFARDKVVSAHPAVSEPKQTLSSSKSKKRIPDTASEPVSENIPSSETAAPTVLPHPVDEDWMEGMESASFGIEGKTYRCPACGGEFIGGHSLNKLSCVFCRSPLAESKDSFTPWRPAKILPFAFDREEAERRLKEWLAEKPFAIKEIYSDVSLRNLQGFYYPLWIMEGQSQVKLSASGEKVRISVMDRAERVEVSTYEVYREGRVDFDPVIVKASTKESDFLDYVFPFPQEDMQLFSLTHLEYFPVLREEKEKGKAKTLIMDMIERPADKLLQETITDYDRITTQRYTLAPPKGKWTLALVPVWLLTCQHQEKTCFFAMNGQTGKIAADIPVGPGRFILLFAGMSAVISGVMFLFLRFF